MAVWGRRGFADVGQDCGGGLTSAAPVRSPSGAVTSPYQLIPPLDSHALWFQRM